MVSDSGNVIPIFTVTSLNPCFNGIWSRTSQYIPNWIIKGVLILVLMEYGLGQMALKDIELQPIGLNPCFNGIWSRT